MISSVVFSVEVYRFSLPPTAVALEFVDSHFCSHWKSKIFLAFPLNVFLDFSAFAIQLLAFRRSSVERP